MPATEGRTRSRRRFQPEAREVEDRYLDRPDRRAFAVFAPGRPRLERRGEKGPRQEDVHNRVTLSRGPTEGREEGGHLWRAGEGPERRVEVVHRVSHLVDGQTLGLAQLPGLLVERLRLRGSPSHQHPRAPVSSFIKEVFVALLRCEGIEPTNRDAGRVGRARLSSGAPAFSSKKNDTWLPLSRKYASDVFFWSVVENTELTVEGSNASTSSSARLSIAATSSGLAKCSITRNPSERNRATCSGLSAPTPCAPLPMPVLFSFSSLQKTVTYDAEKKEEEEEEEEEEGVVLVLVLGRSRRRPSAFPMNAAVLVLSPVGMHSVGCCEGR